MAPPSDEDQTNLGYRLRIVPSAPVTIYRDGFGNRVDLFNILSGVQRTDHPGDLDRAHASRGITRVPPGRGRVGARPGRIHGARDDRVSSAQPAGQVVSRARRIRRRSGATGRPIDRRDPASHRRGTVTPDLREEGDNRTDSRRRGPAAGPRRLPGFRPPLSGRLPRDRPARPLRQRLHPSDRAKWPRTPGPGLDGPQRLDRCRPDPGHASSATTTSRSRSAAITPTFPPIVASGKGGPTRQSPSASRSSQSNACRPTGATGRPSRHPGRPPRGSSLSHAHSASSSTRRSATASSRDSNNRRESSGKL